MNKLLLKVLFSLNFLLITIVISAQITPSSQWAWMKGDNTAPQYGIYGTQGVSNIANKPGSREYSVSWTDNSGNLWLFGGTGYDASSIFRGYLNDLWKYNISLNQWTWVKGSNVINQFGVYGTQGIASNANIPGARLGSITWVDASGNLWLFGGFGESQSGVAGALNDLWKYNPISNQWTWVNGNNTVNNFPIYGTQGVYSSTNNPGGRNNAISWIDGSGNLWLFSGAVPSGNFNDLWKYNPLLNQWAWISGDATLDHAGIYGTKGVASAGNRPGARFNSISWIDNSGILWLFGGDGTDATSGEGHILNDLWKYNTATNQWTWMKGDSTLFYAYGIYGTQGIPDPTNNPGSRLESVSITDALGNLWLFGGNGYAAPGSSGLLNDLWKYDPSINQWTWMKGENIFSGNSASSSYGTQGIPNGTNQPGGRQRHIAWKDNTGNLWIFGGFGNSTSGWGGWLNDLWKLSSNPIPVTLTSIKAYQYNSGINVEWTFAQEIDMDSYEIEKSVTGANFSKAGTVVSSGNHSSVFTYNWFDGNPNDGANFFRIKMFDKNGQVTHSQIVKVVIGRGASISIYPNPVTNNSFALQFNDEPKGSYNIRIMNSTGQLIYKAAMNHIGGSATQTIQLPMLLSKGMYNLEVVNPDSKISVQNLVIQ